MCDIYDLQKRLTKTRVDFEQNVIEAAIDLARPSKITCGWVLVADTLNTCCEIYILKLEASVCVCHCFQRALTLYTQQQTALLRPIYPVTAVVVS